MKKITFFLILFMMLNNLGFCQNSLYAWRLYDDNGNGAVMTLKYNQSNCNYDTISTYTGIGCNVAGYCRRGNASTCDYLIYGMACSGDTGILFLGINHDTSYMVISDCGLFIAVECDYNPTDNCLYILSPYDYLPHNNVKIIKYNLSSGMSSLLATLPINYGFGYGAEQYKDCCTIDEDSNYMYCYLFYPPKFARVNLDNGLIDSLEVIVDSVNLYYGLFFDQDRRIIIGMARNNATLKTYLAAFDPITREVSVIGNLFTPLGDYSYAYDDENDIYIYFSRENNGDKYYFYNSLTGAFIDSCTTFNEGTYACFSPRCNILTSIAEKQLDQNIKVYPTIVNDHLWVEMDNRQTGFKYSIFDNTGRIVSWGKFESGPSYPVKIDLQKLSTGYYFIQLKTKDIKRSFKLVKINN